MIDKQYRPFINKNHSHLNPAQLPMEKQRDSNEILSKRQILFVRFFFTIIFSLRRFSFG
jgi:hypothetical protein